MIKIGFRKNIFYPLMLLLFLFLRIAVDHIMKTYHPYNKNANCLIPLLMSVSQSLFGFIFYIRYSKYENLKEKAFFKNKNSFSKIKPLLPYHSSFTKEMTVI